MAQGMTARAAKGFIAIMAGEAKKLRARTVAIPAFCIPTSMERVLLLAVLKPKALPTRYPSR